MNTDKHRFLIFLSVYIVCLHLWLLLAVVVAADNQLGTINFQTSGSPAAQTEFIKGVLYLHSFEYEDARKTFEAAEKLEPNFAMAYWGEAMTYNHPIWMEQDRESALATLKKLAPTPEGQIAKAATEREKAYLRAVQVLYGEADKKSRDAAYAEAMRQLYEKYPDDMEAACFYALALMGSCEYERDKPIYEKAGAIAEQVFARNPDHPGAAHYIIHAYDDPAHAAKALSAARAYAKIAPTAPHALHMPSHIFLALGMWNDVISSNEASWKASGQTGFHALQWLEYAYLQKGRNEDARKTLPFAEQKAKQNSGPLSVMRAAYLIETRDCKSDVAAIQVNTADLEPSVAAADLFATGFCAINTGTLKEAETKLAQLQKRNATAKPKNPQELVAARIMEKQLDALVKMKQRKTEQAINLAKEAAKEEDAMAFDFGPPLPVKPSHELLGDLFLQQGKKVEAQKEFDLTLHRYPQRRLALLGKKNAE